MKYLLPALVCLFVGYQIGNWLPKRELHMRQAEVKELKEDIRRGAGSGSTGGIGIGSIIPINEPPREARVVVETNIVTRFETITNEVNVVVTNSLEVAQVSTNEVKESREARRDRWRDMGSEERMDELVDMWEFRSNVAKDSFYANLELDSEQAVAFEASVEIMNMRLKQGMETWAEKVRENGTPRVQDGVRLMQMMTSSMVEGYDQLDAGLPENWEDDAGKDFKMFDFIDPRVAQPIFDLEEDGFELDAMQPDDDQIEEDWREDKRRRRGRDR